MSNDFGVPKTHQLTFYMIGFIASIVLTMAAYFVVANHWLAGNALVFTVVGLGSLQAIVQLVFFLHLGQEAKPHWNLIHFIFTILTLFILIGGTAWIMYHLDYQLMSMKEHM